MKIFETDLSSRETTPDPFSDDGNYGSDQDYDPDPELDDSDSSVSNEIHIRSKTGGTAEDESSVSGGSTSEESFESIFDFRVKRRKITAPSNHSADKDTADADTSSIDSEPHLESPLRAQVDDNSTSRASPSLADIEGSSENAMLPLLVPLAPVDHAAPSVPPPAEDHSTPPVSPPPADIEDNRAPLASPPAADIEDNPAPPASPPVPRQSRSSRNTQVNGKRRPRRRTLSPHLDLLVAVLEQTDNDDQDAEHRLQLREIGKILQQIYRYSILMTFLQVPSSNLVRILLLWTYSINCFPLIL